MIKKICPNCLREFETSVKHSVCCCKKCYNKYYNKNNKKRISTQKKEYYLKNKEKRKEYKQQYYYKNREKCIIRSTTFAKLNRNKINKYVKNKRRTNLNFKLSDILRCRLKCALKGNKKQSSAIALVGCSIEDLKRHIESLFKKGMTWDNWSLHGWHIDHIKPISSFNLSDLTQLKQAFHFTNLQPLWAKENLEKSNNE